MKRRRQGAMPHFDRLQRENYRAKGEIGFDQGQLTGRPAPKMARQAGGPGAAYCSDMFQ